MRQRNRRRLDLVEIAARVYVGFVGLIVLLTLVMIVQEVVG